MDLLCTNGHLKKTKIESAQQATILQVKTDRESLVVLGIYVCVVLEQSIDHFELFFEHGNVQRSLAQAVAAVGAGENNKPQVVFLVYSHKGFRSNTAGKVPLPDAGRAHVS